VACARSRRSQIRKLQGPTMHSLRHQESLEIVAGFYDLASGKVEILS
jgi:hypothetical protein